MDTLEHLKDTLLEFYDVFNEGLVSKEEFDLVKEKLLNALPNNTQSLKEKLNTIKAVSHILSDEEIQQVRKALLQSRVANVIGAGSDHDSTASTNDDVEIIKEPPKKVSRKQRTVDLVEIYFM